MSTPGRVISEPAFRPERPRNELARVLRRRRRLRAGVVQLLAAALAVLLAFVAPQVHVGFDIPTTRATEMLLAVGASTITFIGIVFSLLFLVVQFGSTTFTPRLNLFREAPVVWRAFALFTAVVVYSFTDALVITRRAQTSGTVLIVAFVGALVSIIVYRRLQMAAFTSIQLASTLTQVERRGREVIDGLYTHAARATESADDSPPLDSGLWAEITWPGRAAVLQVIDVPRVLRAAERAGAMVRFKVGSGARIAEGSMVAATSKCDKALEQDVLSALRVGEERTFEQDPAFALRVLADIALRAVAPAVNDPTTAVQALDAMDDLLRALAWRDLDIMHVRDADGEIRVSLVLPTWPEYLSVAFEELIAVPALSPTVTRRIRRLLEDLDAIVPPNRRPAIESLRTQVTRTGL